MSPISGFTFGLLACEGLAEPAEAGFEPAEAMPAGQRPKEGEEDWREPLTVSDIPDTEVLAAFFKYLVRISPAVGQDTAAMLIG